MNRLFLNSIIFLTVALILGLAIGAGGFRVDSDIIWSIRGPRVLTAAFAGAATAAAGALSQSLFRNSLATPSVIGTEAGASFALAFASLILSTQDSLLEAPAVYSTVGAALATLASISLVSASVSSGKIQASGSPDSTPQLLLGGFALNALLASGTALCISVLMERGTGLSLYHWLMGSFTARTWSDALGIMAGFVLCIIPSWFLAPTVDVMSVGNDTARSLGINVKGSYVKTLILIAVLIGSAISCAGALPFIGLVAPHMARVLSKPQLRSVLVLSSIFGATLTVLADLAARTVRAPVDMDVGIITTLIGAPYFLWLLRRREVA